MQNRWTPEGLKQARENWSASFGDDLAARIYTARLIGSEPGLVLHGGGNVSLKDRVRDIFGEEVDVVLVKASGGDLSRLEPRQLPALRLDALHRLRGLPKLDDDEMVNQVRLALLRHDAPTPSIETLLHAFLPHRYVDHSHANAVLALTNQATGDTLIREALGDRVSYLPYIRPGFALAKAVADCVEAQPDIEGVVLLFHGLITFSDDAKVAYDRQISLCTACEDFLAERTSGRTLTIYFPEVAEPRALAAVVAPVLRGLLAEPRPDEDIPFQTAILEYRGNEEAINFAGSHEAVELCAKGALTGDHVMHTRPTAFHLADPEWSDEDAWRAALRDGIARFRNNYAKYLLEHGASTIDIPLSPRVIWLAGVGLFTAGSSKTQALIAADLAEYTARVKSLAAFAGEYQALSDDHLFDMEFRTIQRAKLAPESNGNLTGQVVVISGAGGAIGAATAEACAAAGAHVVLTDVDEERLRRAEKYLNQKMGGGRSLAVVMDVTKEDSVRNGFAQIALHYGGLDVLVPNAGIAHVAPIDLLELDDFRRVMEVNALGSFLFLREGVRMMKR